MNAVWVVRLASQARAVLSKNTMAGAPALRGQGPKAVNFLTAFVKNGNKMTKIWGIDNPGKLSYSEKDERTPNKNRRNWDGYS